MLLNPSYGLAGFTTLRAEDEPWLKDCYVPPDDFSLMIGRRSILVYGEVGSGKSSLRWALTRAWEETKTGNGWLLAQWLLHIPLDDAQDQTGSRLVYHQLAQVFDVVARALLQELGRRPGLWTGASNWAQDTLGWFISRHFQGDLSTFVAALIDEPGTIEPHALQQLTNSEWPEVLIPNASPALVIAELARGLTQLGFLGVRVIVEDAEPWLDINRSRLTENLLAFLSTLALFEHPSFAYTMLLPAEMAPHVRRATSERHRVHDFKLQPITSQLVAIVERRLGFAFERDGFVLSDLGPADELRTWLSRCGGNSPRGWLETIQPFAMAFERNVRRKLSPEQCREIQWNHPPFLTFDHTTGLVSVGWRRVEGLSPGHLAMLRYLYDNLGQVCSRKELFRAYVEANPGEQLEPDAMPGEYGGTLDSALYRLRAIVEPDPQAPVLLETRKRQGIVLRIL